MIVKGESQFWFLVSRRTFRDARLSLAARGLLIFLMSVADEDITLKAIAQENRLTRYRLSKLLRELIDARLLERHRVGLHWRYTIQEEAHDD